MVLVNSTLHHDSFDLPPMTGLEATAVCLQLQNHNNLVLASAYLPPSTTLSPSDLEAIFASQDAVILTGDLNCKHAIWNNSSTNKNGNTLLSYCLNKAITINYSNQPTHFPHNVLLSFLEIALSQKCTFSKPLAVPTLTSYHKTIVFKIHLHPSPRTPKPSYDYKHANWPLFRTSLDLTLDPNPSFPTITELEQTITNFSQSILQAAAQAIPVHPLRRNQLTLPPYLLLLWKIKNHYRR